MANVRSAAKRVKQEKKRQIRNTKVQSTTRSVLKKALVAIKNKDLPSVKDAYRAAVSSLARAGGKGFIPQKRAARQIRRLTEFVKKSLPEAFQTL
jgi:small subunit ribosomal protein S20